MTDEFSLHFIGNQPPEVVHRAWRAETPRKLAGHEFEPVDESYNSISYERRYYDWPQKIMFVTTCGTALLFKGFLASRHKLTARFDKQGEGAARVTIAGMADPDTRARLRGIADEHGGPLPESFGV